MDSDFEALRSMMTITSDAGRTFEEKVEALLRLGTSYLGLRSGFLTEIDETTQHIVLAVGDHDLLQPGESCPLSRSYCRKTVTLEHALAVQHAADDGRVNEDSHELFRLETYVGARVEAGENLYGTFCFADTTVRADPFTEAEIVFVELMSLWVSNEIERREMESQLQRQRDRLGEFASVAAHDLRGPLNVATGQLELERAGRDGESEHLDVAYGAVERTSELLTGLLALARSGSDLGAVESVALSDAARESWATVDTTGVGLSVETTATVEADPSRLQQLFENLFRNAVEHGRAGDSDPGSEHGAITVTVADIDGGFLVGDDGGGIPADVRDAVTDIGYTTKEDGTGFGLNIVRGIANAHGWTLEITDGTDGGARLEFTGVDGAVDSAVSTDRADV
jgi:signal transduction histidine kinase